MPKAPAVLYNCKFLRFVLRYEQPTKSLFVQDNGSEAPLKELLLPCPGSQRGKLSNTRCQELSNEKSNTTFIDFFSLSIIIITS